MKYDIRSYEDGLEVVNTYTKDTIAQFPTLKQESFDDTNRRAELYVAMLLRDGQ